MDTKPMASKIKQVPVDLGTTIEMRPPRERHPQQESK